LKARHWSVLLAILSLAFVSLMARERDSLSTVWGDESTYLAMAESLVEDGDLRFTEADAARLAATAAREGESLSRSTVILHRTESGIAYSKPVLYALLAAPAVLVAGATGPVLLNLVLLLVAGWLGWLFLERLGTGGQAGLTLVTFIGASVVLAHVGWRMTDLLQATLSLSGLVLVLACLRRRQDAARSWLDRPAAAWLGGGLLGVLVVLRLPNLLVVVAALAALVVAGRARRAGRVALAALAVFALMGLLSQGLVGTSSPYRAVRSSFDVVSGYPTAAAGSAAERFETHATTQRMGVIPNFRPVLSAYSAFYFWVGRHSGLLWYFPAALALFATALWRPDRVTWTLLLGVVGSIAFYLIWWPDNYFGGSTFLGNRYFLAVYPLLLLALARLPGRGALVGTWLLAAVVGVSSLLSLGGEPTKVASQSHTRAGFFPHLPYESTARAIDGRRDRYWADDFVRFVDPALLVSQEAFILDGHANPTEALIVTKEIERAILLRYRTKVDGLELAVEQRGETVRYPLGGPGGARNGSLTLPLTPSWRRHPFPWDEEALYSAYPIRFSLVGADEDASEAERRVRFWYAGDPTVLDQSFKYLPGKLVLPRRAMAGSTTQLRVQVRNMSPLAWMAEGVFPVSLGYQLLAEEIDSEAVAPASLSLVEGPRVGLGAIVRSGDPVELVLPIEWPEVPGRYRLRVDLLIEDYNWFAARIGEPLAEGVVLIEAPGE